ncbi:hypothetical protein ADEAN_000882100 [Angomonas deanei]|uniref:Uncharacterized protein n=1 Tax=Angomonas deanei TaxID=59799 RepID=A0A7G2CPK5_9TRYP|nr:hypothetical protein ADEAN_000882100 [Angomonas deanei]
MGFRGKVWPFILSDHHAAFKSIFVSDCYKQLWEGYEKEKARAGQPAVLKTIALPIVNTTSNTNNNNNNNVKPTLNTVVVSADSIGQFIRIKSVVFAGVNASSTKSSEKGVSIDLVISYLESFLSFEKIQSILVEEGEFEGVWRFYALRKQERKLTMTNRNNLMNNNNTSTSMARRPAGEAVFSSCEVGFEGEKKKKEKGKNKK